MDTDYRKLIIELVNNAPESQLIRLYYFIKALLT